MMNPGIATAALVTALAAGSGSLPPAMPHWPRGATILTWVDPVDAPAGGADLVARAMRTWTTAADGRFSLQSTTFENRAGLRVHFIRYAFKFGETIPQVDPQSGDIVRADVGITVNSHGDDLDRRIVTYLTALHEIGHALGLPHRDEFSSIMYSFRLPNDSERYFGGYRALLSSANDVGSSAASGLSTSDVAVVRALYDR
jgi:Matrixin